jgi:ATP-dependent Lon protease
VQDKGRFADLAVGLMNATLEDNQAYLNELSVPNRLMRAIAICKKELELLSLQKDISRQVRADHIVLESRSAMHCAALDRNCHASCLACG